MNSSNFPQLMVDVAQQRILADVLRAIVEGIASCGDVVLARLWLVDDGDVCTSCRFLPECPDQTRCLHLVASAGNSIEPQTDHRRLDGAFRRFPLGVRKIGRVGKTGEPLLVSGLDGGEPWIAEPVWVRREGVRSFAAQPLAFRGESLGVLAIFDRGVLQQTDFAWIRVLADHAAVSIANARAFEEIERLRVRLEEENAYLREEVSVALGGSDLVGESPGLRNVMQQIDLVAPTDAAVLVTGESGTGKELVAREIHGRSRRSARALIKVNCSAIPDSLFESEFFGHVKGAFTGALADRPGRFELAEGGTLFLDEIGEVPLSLQAKLLRALQEHEVERVGDTRTRKVDVRIVAATNRNLRREVDAGRFREDLFYRLSVFPIEIPPLRDRRSDIPALAAHFVAQSARRMNRPVPKISQGTMSRLVAHEWPGNVRELQNAIERAVIRAQGGSLRFEQAGVPAREATRSAPPADSSGVVTRQEWKRTERESIAAALKESGGKVFGPDGAAERLGMKPTTLASRITALGLKRRSGS